MGGTLGVVAGQFMGVPGLWSTLDLSGEQKRARDPLFALPVNMMAASTRSPLASPFPPAAAQAAAASAKGDVAVELAGMAMRHVQRLCRDTNRGAKLVEHTLDKKPLADPGIARMIAASIMHDLDRLMSTCTTLYVVGEGNYMMKAPTRERRSKKAARLAKERKWSQCAAVPDCVVQQVRDKVATRPRMVYVNPPAEAEATGMYFLRAGFVALFLVTSNDSDVAVYDTGGKGSVVITSRIDGKVGSRARHSRGGGVHVFGQTVKCEGLWRQVAASEDQADELPAWSMRDRAMAASVCGCDYDTASTRGTDPAPLGLSKHGMARALKVVAEVRKTHAGASDVDYFKKGLPAALKKKGLEGS